MGKTDEETEKLNNRTTIFGKVRLFFIVIQIGIIIREENFLPYTYISYF